MVPVSGQDTTEWLKQKSQEDLWALLKQGNPQDVIPYTLALTSQLNQVGFTALNLATRRVLSGRELTEMTNVYNKKHSKASKVFED